MQAKKVWSDCRKQRLQALASKLNTETLKQQKLEPISGTIAQVSDIPSRSDDHATKGLQEAFIFTLRSCYSNVQSENKDQISRLQIQLGQSKDRLHNLSYYEDLKRKSALGFDAGFELGQSEVRKMCTQCMIDFETGSENVANDVEP